MHCKFCGKEIEDGKTYCFSCGKFQDVEYGSSSSTKRKKPIFLRWWFLLIVGLLLLRGFGALSNAKSKSDQSVKIQTAISTIEILLDDHFENYDVSYEDELLTIDVWQDGVSNWAELAIAGDESCLEMWNQLVEVAKEYSLSISELLESYGITGIPVIVNVLNDKNTDYALLTASGGIAIKDYVGGSIGDISDSTYNSEKTENTVVPTESDTATLGEKNALRSARSYLNYTAFSYKGLIEQLEFEGYSTDEATYAAKNCGADWNEQALESALDYLDYTAFSYSGLIEQLEFEGFTVIEATYGADNCGADWNEQAAKCAEEYLEYTAFSRQGLIEQLLFEGFTQAQAEYGVRAVGY